MKKILPLIAVTAVFIAACVPSVNPFYTDKDVITDSHLPGTWQEDGNKDKPNVWKFETTTNNAYSLTLTDGEGKTGKFESHLFKMGEATFLDLTPSECDFSTNQAALASSAMIPGHLLLRVRLSADKLNLAVCNPDWVKKYLAEHDAEVAHRITDGSVVLTDTTSALQKFVLKHMGQDELFNEGMDCSRRGDTGNGK